MSEINNIQLLEKALAEKCRDTSKFPMMKANYFMQYTSFLNHLRTHIYSGVDMGLAIHSKGHGYYTAHDGEHFDEVVRYAGLLLGVTEENYKDWNSLSPYELYVLLIAIRIHDVGNIHGREEHEKKCFQILRDNKSFLGGDIAELKIIAGIAQAHGGSRDGDKDTIRYLAGEEIVANIVIRPRFIAAIVRFADEICEHSNRAASYQIEHGSLPHQSQIYHYYASAIKSSIYSHEEKRITLKYKVTIDEISHKWGCGERIVEGKIVDSVYLIDEIIDRLDKMDRERRYCNNYTRGFFVVESIRASIEILHPEDYEAVEVISIPELVDEGYPEEKSSSLKERLKSFSGEEMAKKHAVL